MKKLTSFYYESKECSHKDVCEVGDKAQCISCWKWGVVKHSKFVTDDLYKTKQWREGFKERCRELK